MPCRAVPCVGRPRPVLFLTPSAGAVGESCEAFRHVAVQLMRERETTIPSEDSLEVAKRCKVRPDGQRGPIALTARCPLYPLLGHVLWCGLIPVPCPLSATYVELPVPQHPAWSQKPTAASPANKPSSTNASKSTEYC